MTKLMGILNVTPDSFYTKSRCLTIKEALENCSRLSEEGADIIDIGGESSRPGALSISEDEELDRVLPVLHEIKKTLTIPISIDTTKPKVAQAAINAGASLINDISGFRSDDMISLAKNENVDICLMHMHGTPQTMQLNPVYDENIVTYLLKWFDQKISKLLDFGIHPEKIIIDPGIGFGKTIADNLEIIHNLAEFKRLGFRILLGISRKSFLGKILNRNTDELLPATLAINTLALASMVDIIRVHDVKEHRMIINLMKVYTQQQALGEIK